MTSNYIFCSEQKYYVPQVRPEWVRIHDFQIQYISCHWDPCFNHLAISDFREYHWTIYECICLTISQPFHEFAFHQRSFLSFQVRVYAFLWLYVINSACHRVSIWDESAICLKVKTSAYLWQGSKTMVQDIKQGCLRIRIRIRVYLLSWRNLLWDILRLPSSRRAALGLYVMLTLWRGRGTNQPPYTLLHRSSPRYALRQVSLRGGSESEGA